MAQLDKLKARLRQRPADFSWEELEKLLKALEYQPMKQGKTGGSRRKFIHPNGSTISLHKPHPGNILKRYQITQIIETLSEEKLL